jgi:hypothetical protein
MRCAYALYDAVRADMLEHLIALWHAARVQIETACPCASKDYASCVKKQAKTLVSKQCREAVTECAKESTCGKKDAVACLVPAKHGHEVECEIEKSEKKCLKKGGVVSAQTSCCADCAVCAGGSCNVGGDCTSHFCDNGVCGVGSTGDACVCGGDCLSQFCDGGTCG